VGVNLGGFYIGMAHQFLHHPDIDAVLKQAGGKRRTTGMTAYGFGDTGSVYRHLHRLLQAGFKHMVPAQGIASGIMAKTLCREDILPSQFPCR
jgi:hypothetical protein